MTSEIHCAIGDIHGELGRLKDLHAQVFELARREFPKSRVQLVHLGDLVDRGPKSSGVVSYLMSLRVEGWPAPITLRGNHEQMMVDALETQDRQSSEWRLWSNNGGLETLDSYAAVPPEEMQAHIAWMRALPTLHVNKAAGLVFVHGGVDPDAFPDCTEHTHMWSRRREFFDPRCWTAPALRGMRVVHGHTPTVSRMPETGGQNQRLNIDTGAVYGGRLTAVFLRSGKPDVFLHA